MGQIRDGGVTGNVRTTYRASTCWGVASTTTS